jgi:hypothetical protein
MQRMLGRQNGSAEILVKECRERKLVHGSRLLSGGPRPIVCQRVGYKLAGYQSIRYSNRGPYSGVGNMFFVKMQLGVLRGREKTSLCSPAKTISDKSLASGSYELGYSWRARTAYFRRNTIWQ